MLSKNSEFHIKHFNITWINLICSNPEQNINATSKPSVYVYLKKNFVNCGTMLPPGRKWLAHPLWTAQMAQPYRWNLRIKNHLDVGHNIISRRDWKIVTLNVGGKREWHARAWEEATNIRRMWFPTATSWFVDICTHFWSYWKGIYRLVAIN